MRNRILVCSAALIWGVFSSRAAIALPAQEPLFLANGVRPMVMFAMSVDHQLFKKAFDDYTNLDGEGPIENTYTDSFDYYGYFDSNRCYTYDNAAGYFVPEDEATGANGHHCGGSEWSGNFLNWATMTRIDVLRKALYGGKRAVDTADQTVLERAYLANDVHSFAKVFTPAAGDSTQNYTPYSQSTITLCNSTPQPPDGQPDESQNIDTATNPPKMRVVSGDWGRWAAGERNQCEFYEDAKTANKNAGIVPAYAQNLFGPNTKNAPSVKVETCVTGKLGVDCYSYNGTDAKPVGLLQRYGDDGTLRFGLMSGSYKNRDKGGVLRKAISNFAGNATASEDEVNLADGTFNTSVEGIVYTLNKVRLNTWDYGDTHYNDCDTYSIGINTYLTSTASNRQCSNWGNPISEMYLEAVRYLIGEETATSAFNVTSSSDDYGLPPADDWDDPMPVDEWCTPMNIVLLSSGDNDFDTDHLSTVPAVLGSINSATDAIGVAEGFSGEVFIGEVGSTPVLNPDTNICTAKTFTSLSQMRGLCPTSPNKQGGYAVAGLAYKSHTTDLRSDRKNDPVTGEGQTINTYAIAMAKNLPDFVLPLGNGALTLVPIAYAGPTSSTPEIDSAEWKSSSLAQLTIEEQIFAGDGDLRYVRFLALWEDSAWGNDYDMDMVSRISMCVADECTKHDDDGDGVNDLNPGADTARVTIRFMHAEGGVSMKIGFVTSGTTTDGEYAEVRKAAGGAANFSSFDDDPGRDVEEPLPESYEFVAGSSPADNLPLPLELAAKYGSFKDSDGDDLPGVRSEWDGNNDDMADSFFFADDPSQIGPKLAAYLAETADASSSASVVANSVSLQTTTRIYQAQFDSTVWSGSVVSYPVDVATGTLLPAEWNASTETAKLDWDSEREWLTWAGTDADGDGFPDDADADGVPDGGGVPFRWGSLDTGQQAFLDTPPGDVPPATDGFGEDRVEYLRGNRYYEVTQGNVVGGSPSFRDRLTLSGNPYGLGDVVHSTPTVVGVPNFGYPDGLESSTPYSSFKAQYANVDCADDAKDREPILYFGGNDGALHGVSACDGAERIAYVPRAVYPWLKELTSVDYAHRFFVDGAPTVVDAYFGSDDSWHTVLVGTLAAGGAGVFALDVTDPSKFDESYADDVVLWDIVATPPPSDPDEPDSDFQELGFTFSQPAVVKAEGHGWVAVFGNGYHGGPTNPYPGANSKAVLYFVDIETGELLQKIDFSTVSAGDQTHNGLSTVAPVDRDGDGDVDLIYAGDLKGNVWRVAATIPAGPPTFVQGTGFQTASVSRLYKAMSKDGVDQPITSRMSVGYHPTSAVGRMVYFGTGKYYEDADQDPLNAVQYNTMYGIWDRDDPSLSPGSVTTRNSDILQQQTIEVETSSSFDLNLFEVRTVSNTPVTWALPDEGCDTDESCGWYLDLTDVGEKMVSTPILRGGRLIFVTTIPSQETCGAGGTGWLMELCAATGGRCDYPVFDLNGDGLFDLQDNLAQDDGEVTSYTPVSGKKSKVGILQPPAILAGIGGPGDGSYGGVEGKYASGSNQARIDVTIENPGLLGAGRKSWVRIK